MTSPSGDSWEIYVSKTKLPQWRERDTDPTFAQGRETTFDVPVAFVGFVWGSILVPLARVLVLLPVAVIRGRRSHAVRVEAVNPFPQRQILLWTTTDVHAARVVDEIASGLAAGKVAQPDGAFYYGREDS